MGTRVLVTGAGGFIGHHLVKFLVERGYWVRGVDLKLPEYEPTSADEFEILDLRRWDNCLVATRGVEEVHHLAADMGGIGYISYHHGDSARSNVLASTHMLEASRLNAVSRFFFSRNSANGLVSELVDSRGCPAAYRDSFGLLSKSGFWSALFRARASAERGCSEVFLKGFSSDFLEAGLLRASAVKVLLFVFLPSGFIEDFSSLSGRPNPANRTFPNAPPIFCPKVLRSLRASLVDF